MKPSASLSVGTSSAWHFRSAAGVFGVAAVAELTGQAVRGPAGAGPAGWLLLLAAAAWVIGLVWRERVGVFRAWLCFVWVMLMSLLVMLLAVRHGFLFGPMEFSGREHLSVAGVPCSVPLLWWLVVGGGYLVVEGLWGEWRAGVSAYTAVITVLMALMILPFVGQVRGYWRWPAGPTGSPPAGDAFFGMPWTVLAAWFALALGLALGLVIQGDNWSSAEARSRRQAWAPAAVWLTLTIIFLGANLAAGLWLAVAFSVANAVLFGAVVVGYLRESGGGRR
ncbi:MAG: carotenoid biosynthesis protein [Opitutaceae bacterium]|nr:carotenoid biosynthesis protein [Opitutaceae bacterium]